MLDQLRIGDKSSLDFDASIAERDLPEPKKKSIKETVPFSNKPYDFSSINGELYWEERELNYIFEIIADSPQELEEKKIAFASWVMNVEEQAIFDPYIPDYHFIGTYDDMDWSDEEHLLKTTASVTFTAYPYKIANEITRHSFTVPASDEINVTVLNSSSHRLTPSITSNLGVVLRLGEVSYSIPEETVTDDSFKLENGINEITITNANETDCTLTLEYYREVF